MYSKVLLVLCIGVFLTIPSAQTKYNESQVFDQAKRLYAAGKYDSTVILLRQYVKNHGKDPSMEYIVPLLMEALVRQDDHVYFKRLMKIYFQKYADSKYMPRLLYLKGIIEGREKEYLKSIVSFSDALKKGLSPDLDSLTRLNVQKICENALSSIRLESLANDATLDPTINEIITYYAIVKLYTEGQNPRAKKLNEDFKAKYPESEYNSAIKKLAAKYKDTIKNSILIGVLAPLSGEQADIGKTMVQSIKTATETVNRNNSVKIELIVLDTKSSGVETAKRVHELTKIHKVPAFIGPVTSTEAVVASSAIMDRDDIVMITPTATDDGIAQLGNNIFQLNTTPGVLGKSIAHYAVQDLRLKEFAVLSPLTAYGKAITQKFKEEVKQMGGIVVAEDLFEPGINDYRAQFENLRRQLCQYLWDKSSVVEGYVPKTPKEKLSFIADSLVEIGGFFVPGDAEDIAKIASQVYFYRIRTQMLGTAGWHSPVTVQEGKKYVENAIFSTNFEVDPQNERWVAFVQLYKQMFGDQPDNVIAPLTYDAANLLYTALTNGKVSAKDITDHFKTIRSYQGISGIISFNDLEGVNTEAAIYKISNKKFIRLQ